MKYGLNAICLFCLTVISLSAIPEPPAIGSETADFSLQDVRTGESVRLSSLLSDREAVAVIFIATACPYSNAFNQVMSDLAREYESRGIGFVGINPNKTEPAGEVEAHAKENGFPFPVLKDPGNKVADEYGAVVTPEVFLIDKGRILRYHGALGNSRQPTTNAAEANGDEFRAAADALLGGESIDRATTKMFGCTIKR